MTLVDEARPLTLKWTECPGEFSKAECDEIVRIGESFPGGAPLVVPGSPGRRRGTAHKIERCEATAWVFDRLHAAAHRTNDAFYKLDIDEIHPRPEYVEYIVGDGQFDWHNDYSHEGEHPQRKLTVIAQLSEPHAYDGGDLQVQDDDLKTLPKTRGSLLIFPAFSIHRVMPVTRGVRRALVSWFGGPRLR